MNCAPHRIEPLFCSQARRYFAEVYDRRGRLLFTTTKTFETKHQAIGQAKAMLKDSKNKAASA